MGQEDKVSENLHYWLCVTLQQYFEARLKFDVPHFGRQLPRRRKKSSWI